ncbi:MAG: YcaO-like family protein [Acidobacteriota bacterium]
MSASVSDSRTAKGYRLGTHRIVDPATTWQRLQPVLHDVGVTRVADVTRLDRLDIPVFQAIRPASHNLSVSQGKGVTADAARVSAVMESIELFHVEELVGVEQMAFSLNEMRAINPLATDHLPWLPTAPRLGSLQIDWVAATELATERRAWLPKQAVELDLRLPDRFVPRMFHQSSSGLASGNHLAEALVHALTELIERHGVYLSAHAGRPRRAIDPDSVETPFCVDLIARFRDAGARLAIHDLSWEVGLPVVSVALSLPDLPHVFGGSGCHPSRDVALSRALTEAAQSRLTFISGARDDLPALTGGLDDLPLPDHPMWRYLPHDDFVEPEPERRLDQLPDCAGDDVATDLDTILDALARLNTHAYAVDLTRDDIGVAVVKTYIPGLGESHEV